MHVTGGWVVGRQNLNDLLHVALFTMRICSCRVSRLPVGFRSITRGRPSQLFHLFASAWISSAVRFSIHVARD